MKRVIKIENNACAVTYHEIKYTAVPILFFLNRSYSVYETQSNVCRKIETTRPKPE